MAGVPKIHKRVCNVWSTCLLAFQMEKSRCFGRPSAATLVEKVRDWETKSGNPNLLTKPRIGWHDSYMYTM